ncbi:hypothetical protein ACFWC6_30830 [Micromonospora chalcea]
MITRPNGKPYRPRKPGLRAHAYENEDDCGVIVFGTLDPEQARPFAAEMCNHWYGMPMAVNPAPGWYRNGFRDGERAWIPDEQRGAPGVMFRAEDAPLGALP